MKPGQLTLAALFFGYLISSALILTLLAATFALPWIESGANDTFGHFLFHTPIFVTSFSLLLTWILATLILHLLPPSERCPNYRLLPTLLLSGGYWAPLCLTCPRLVAAPAQFKEAVAALIAILTVAGVGLLGSTMALAWSGFSDDEQDPPPISYERL